MLGYMYPEPRIRVLTLANELHANHDRPTYHPAIVGDKVRALPWIGSADLRSLAAVNGFIVLPSGPVEFAAGAPVNTLILE
jgi:molybdopterin biosynthesis enzyme